MRNFRGTEIPGRRDLGMPATKWLSLLSTVISVHRANGDACASDTVSLSFSGACAMGVQHSNLGGAGPDTGAENIRLVQLGNLNGQPFDLVISVLDRTGHYETMGGFPDTAYASANNAKNGCLGLFGSINMQLGVRVTFRMEFRDTNTDAVVVLPGFRFSFFDIDAPANGGQTIEVRSCNSAASRLLLCACHYH